MGWAGNTFNGKYCWFVKLVPKELLVMTCIVGLIPIIIVVVLYSIILYHAIKKQLQLHKGEAPPANENDLRMFRGRSAVNTNTVEAQPEKNFFKRLFKKSQNSASLQNPSKAKAIKIVFLTTGSFVITWVPYFMASFLYVSCDQQATPKKCDTLRVLIASPLAILGFCNSLFNPFIYAWWHKGFRTYVKKMLCKKKVEKGASGTSGSNTDGSSSRKTSTSKTSNKVHPTSDIPMVTIDLN